MKNEINDWLKSKREYSTGLELFDKHVKSRILSRILYVGGATFKNEQTLAYELKKFLLKLNQTSKPVNVITWKNRNL